MAAHAKLTQTGVTRIFWRCYLDFYPVKNSLSTDGESSVFVGFHHEQQMLRLKNEKRVVQLNNCEVKKSYNSDKMDVMLKSSTAFGESNNAIVFAEYQLQ